MAYDDRSNKEKNKSFALSYAKDVEVAMIAAGVPHDMNRMLALAAAFDSWLDGETAEVAKPKAEKPATQKAATAKKAAAPKKKAAPAKKKPDPVPPPAYGFGEPDPDEPFITAKEASQVIKAFTRFEITEDELETVSGLPVANWTPSIKKVANSNYGMLKREEMTKDDFLS